MVIDLTRKPVVVNTDICPAWVVVRTASNASVDGRLRRKLDKNERRRGRGETNIGGEMVEVEIGASSPPRTEKTLHETRLPIDHIRRRRGDDPFTNPYEVATVYTDAFTGRVGVWRAQILAAYAENRNGGVWLITIRDEALKIDLFTASAKDLDDKRGELTVEGATLPDDRFPLNRINPGTATAPLSVWDRIRRTQYRPNSGDDLDLDGEEPSS